MELVEGEDLAERLKRGAIPVDEAIAIAKQIAEALEEAHEHGIVHRDLKPANIKLTPDGKVKVLDFGLAKALQGDPAGSGAGRRHLGLRRRALRDARRQAALRGRDGVRLRLQQSNLRRSYDVTRDAAWILAITTPFANQPRQIEVVTDWASELARLAPRGKR